LWLRRLHLKKPLGHRAFLPGLKSSAERNGSWLSMAMADSVYAVFGVCGPGSLSVGPAWGSDLIGPDITTHYHPLPPITTHPRITTHYHALRITTHYHALQLPRTTHYHALPLTTRFAFCFCLLPTHYLGTTPPIAPRTSVFGIARYPRIAHPPPAGGGGGGAGGRRGGAFGGGGGGGGAMGGHMNANGLLWHGGMGGDPQGAWLHCVVCRKSKKEETERSFCFCFC
jgi:hypothetical protein